MSTGTPIITCGNSKQDAIGVHAGMKAGNPAFDVIYAGFSLPETLQELPQILTGNPPTSLHTQVAANDFSRRPRAVVCGGGYSDEAFDTLHRACVDAAGGDAKVLGVAWFRADRELTERLVKEGKGPAPHTDEYPRHIGGRLRDKLQEVGVADGLKEDDVGKLFRY